MRGTGSRYNYGVITPPFHSFIPRYYIPISYYPGGARGVPRGDRRSGGAEGGRSGAARSRDALEEREQSPLRGSEEVRPTHSPPEGTGRRKSPLGSTSGGIPGGVRGRRRRDVPGDVEKRPKERPEGVPPIKYTPGTGRRPENAKTEDARRAAGGQKRRTGRPSEEEQKRRGFCSKFALGREVEKTTPNFNIIKKKCKMNESIFTSFLLRY